MGLSHTGRGDLLPLTVETVLNSLLEGDFSVCGLGFRLWSLTNNSALVSEFELV